MGDQSTPEIILNAQKRLALLPPPRDNVDLLHAGDQSNPEQLRQVSSATEATFLHKTQQKVREKLLNDHVPSGAESPDAPGYFISALIKLKDFNTSHHLHLHAYIK